MVKEQASMLQVWDITSQFALRTIVVTLFSRSILCDIMAAMLVYTYQNKETAAVLVYEANPAGVVLYFHAHI